MIATTLVEIPQWGSITLIELIWLLSGVVAAGFTGSHLSALWKDYRAAKTTSNKVIMIMSRDYLRREVLRSLEAALILGLGGYAGVSDPPVPGPAFITIVGLVLTGVFLLIGTFVSIQSYWDWHSRKEIKEILK